MSTTGGQIDSTYDDQTGYDTSVDQYPPDWNARRSAVQKRDDWTCQDCGVKSGPHAGDDGVVLDVHHKTPLSEGGSNELSNLVTLCVPCHNDRHDHDITVDRDGYSSPPGLFDRLKAGGRWVLAGLFVLVGHVTIGSILVRTPVGEPLWGAGVGGFVVLTMAVLLRPAVVARLYFVAAGTSGLLLYSGLLSAVSLPQLGAILGTTIMPLLCACGWWLHRR